MVADDRVLVAADDVRTAAQNAKRATSWPTLSSPKGGTAIGRSST